MVTRVEVAIHDNGTILERGEAVPSETDGMLWIYSTMAQVTPAAGILLEARAYDLAGNCGSASISLG